MKPFALLILLAAYPIAWADEPNAQALINRHQKEQASVWADPDTLTFFYQGEADQVTVVFNGNFTPLTRVAKTDVWILHVKLPEVNKAVFSFELKPKPLRESAAPVPETWRGPQAPPPALKVNPLKGTISEHQIESQSLSAQRAVTIYLPPHFEKADVKRVVYAADGQAITRFA